MHHDRESARAVARETTVWQAFLWILLVALVMFVIALSLQHRDAMHKIEQLEETSGLLSKRMAACEGVRDDLTDLQKRVTGVEAQFWE